MKIQYEKSHPMVVLQRSDWTLKLKGLYSILFLVGNYDNETLEQKIKRCTTNEDTDIENLLQILVNEGFLQNNKNILEEL